MPGLKHWPGNASVQVRELDVVSFISPPSTGLCWWGAACNLWPSRMQSSYPVAGFHPVLQRGALQFTILRLRSTTGAPLTPAAVARVLSTTNFRDDKLLIQRH